MPDIFEYPIGAIIAALIAVTVSLVTIWATIRRERREALKARKEIVENLRTELKEYVNLRLNGNDEIKRWIQRLEDRIDKRESVNP